MAEGTIWGIEILDLLGGLSVMALIAYGGWAAIAALIERLPKRGGDADRDEDQR